MKAFMAASLCANVGFGVYSLMTGNALWSSLHAASAVLALIIMLTERERAK